MPAKTSVNISTRQFEVIFSRGRCILYFIFVNKSIVTKFLPKDAEMLEEKRSD